MEKTFVLITIFLGLSLSVRCSRFDFPEGFVFGAGTSAYQWEGAVSEDGRLPSIWDTFCHSHNNGNGDIACDGCHKYKEDVKLMVDIGLDAFRFSKSWSRIIPNGRGTVNQKGLQFYKNLINELISNGIEPHVTLYHYDHPQSLEDEYGGWLNHKMIQDFTAYADVCFREFGNQVKFWTTINEANIFSIGGYTDGTTSPGRCSECFSGNSSTETYIVSHNLLLAHASASRIYRQKYKIQGGSVGFSIFTLGMKPYTSSNDDKIAMQRAKEFYLGWMLEPLTNGDYPDEMKRIVGSRLPNFSEEESEQVKGSSDTERIEFLQAYIGGVLNAIRNGSDTRGYFVWSLMDMYEILSGYESGFGLYTVNFSDPHRKRTPKLSAHRYSDFLKGKTTSLRYQRSIIELQSSSYS